MKENVVLETWKFVFTGEEKHSLLLRPGFRKLDPSTDILGTQFRTHPEAN